MGYKMEVTSQGGERQVSFKHGWRWVNLLGLLLIVVGVPIGLFGLLAVMVTLGEPLELGPPLGMLGLGMFLGGAGIIIMISPKDPDRLTFNNLAGVLEIDEGGRIQRLPYSEVRGFTVKKYTSSSSRSSGGTSTSHSWRIHMIKHDGVAWTLSTYRDEAKALATLATLNEVVHLGGALTAKQSIEAISPSGLFLVQRRPGATKISWTPPRARFRAVIGTGLIGGAMIGMIGMALSTGDILPGVIAAVIGLAFVYGLSHLATSFTSGPSVEVQPGQLAFSGGKGPFVLKWSVPIEQVASVAFNLDPSQGRSHIMVLNPDQLQTYSNVFGGGQFDGGVGALFSLMMNMKKIDVIGLRMGHCIELERLIQDEIKTLSGKTVL